MFIAISESCSTRPVDALVIVALVITFFFSARRPLSSLGRFHSEIPYIGPLSTEINIIGLSRTLNLSCVAASRSSSAGHHPNTISNLVYQDEIKRIADTVRRGEPMSRAMIENPVSFAPLRPDAMWERVPENSMKPWYFGRLYENERTIPPRL